MMHRRGFLAALGALIVMRKLPPPERSVTGGVIVGNVFTEIHYIEALDGWGVGHSWRIQQPKRLFRHATPRQLAAAAALGFREALGQLNQPIMLKPGEAIVIRASENDPYLTVVRAEDIPPGGQAIIKAFGSVVLHVAREQSA